MSKTTYNWYTALALSFIASVAIAGIGVISVCAYDLALILQQSSLDEKISRELSLIATVDCQGYRIGDHAYALPDSHGCQPGDEKGKEGERALMGLGSQGGRDTYKWILLICCIAAIVLGFFQFLGSISFLCSCNKGTTRGKVKAWILVSIVIFLLGLLCLIIPLSYNVAEGEYFGLNPHFGAYLNSKVKHLVQVKEVEQLLRNLYFYFLGANEALLLVSVVLLGALLPCGTQPYHSVYGEE